MKKQLLLPVAVFLFTIMQACAPVYYSPNAHNVPVLTQKGETTASVLLGGGEEVDLGVDVQASKALTNHVALMGNFYNASGKQTGGSGRGSFFELGGGYFNPVAPALFKASHNPGGTLMPSLVFSAFGGAGLGTVINFYDGAKIHSSRSNFSRIFVQPALGLKTSYLEAALSLRVANLHYYSIKYREGQPNYQGRAFDFFGEQSYFLWEPAATIRGGWEYIKLQAQIGLSINQTDSNLYQEHFNVNLGLYCNLFPKKGKREK